ncbi:Centrosomal protein cep57L1 [Gonapodya sp. JEL0774]|nr:Centrosomal protein cep57L1 [Gonapodya sp. JEL0774]
MPSMLDLGSFNSEMGGDVGVSKLEPGQRPDARQMEKGRAAEALALVKAVRAGRTRNMDGLSTLAEGGEHGQQLRQTIQPAQVLQSTNGLRESHHSPQSHSPFGKQDGLGAGDANSHPSAVGLGGFSSGDRRQHLISLDSARQHSRNSSQNSYMSSRNKPRPSADFSPFPPPTLSPANLSVDLSFFMNSTSSLPHNITISPISPVAPSPFDLSQWGELVDLASSASSLPAHLPLEFGGFDGNRSHSRSPSASSFRNHNTHSATTHIHVTTHTPLSTRSTTATKPSVEGNFADETNDWYTIAHQQGKQQHKNNEKNEEEDEDPTDRLLNDLDSHIRRESGIDFGGRCDPREDCGSPDHHLQDVRKGNIEDEDEERVRMESAEGSASGSSTNPPRQSDAHRATPASTTFSQTHHTRVASHPTTLSSAPLEPPATGEQLQASQRSSSADNLAQEPEKVFSSPPSQTSSTSHRPPFVQLPVPASTTSALFRSPSHHMSSTASSPVIINSANNSITRSALSNSLSSASVGVAPSVGNLPARVLDRDSRQKNTGSSSSLERIEDPDPRTLKPPLDAAKRQISGRKVGESSGGRTIAIAHARPPTKDTRDDSAVWLSQKSVEFSPQAQLAWNHVEPNAAEGSWPIQRQPSTLSDAAYHISRLTAPSSSPPLAPAVVPVLNLRSAPGPFSPSASELSLMSIASSLLPPKRPSIINVIGESDTAHRQVVPDTPTLTKLLTEGDYAGVEAVLGRDKGSKGRGERREWEKEERGRESRGRFRELPEDGEGKAILAHLRLLRRRLRSLSQHSQQLSTSLLASQHSLATERARADALARDLADARAEVGRERVRRGEEKGESERVIGEKEVEVRRLRKEAEEARNLVKEERETKRRRRDELVEKGVQVGGRSGGVEVREQWVKERQALTHRIRVLESELSLAHEAARGARLHRSATPESERPRRSRDHGPLSSPTRDRNFGRDTPDGRDAQIGKSGMEDLEAVRIFNSKQLHQTRNDRPHRRSAYQSEDTEWAHEDSDTEDGTGADSDIERGREVRRRVRNALLQIENNPRLQAILFRRRSPKQEKKRAAMSDTSAAPESTRSEPSWVRIDPSSPRKRPGSVTTRDRSASRLRRAVSGVVGIGDLESSVARKLPFIMGTNTGRSHSVTANLQQIFAMLKSHNPVLCTICSSRPRPTTRRREEATSPMELGHDVKMPVDPRLTDIRVADVGRHWPELKNAATSLEGEVEGLRRQYLDITAQHAQLASVRNLNGNKSTQVQRAIARLERELKDIADGIEIKKEQISLIYEILEQSVDHERSSRRIPTDRNTNSVVGSSQGHPTSSARLREPPHPRYAPSVRSTVSAPASLRSRSQPASSSRPSASNKAKRMGKSELGVVGGMVGRKRVLPTTKVVNASPLSLLRGAKAVQEGLRADSFLES